MRKSVLLFLALPSVVLGSTVHEQPYRYFSDVAKYQKGTALVIGEFAEGGMLAPLYLIGIKETEAKTSLPFSYSGLLGPQNPFSEQANHQSVDRWEGQFTTVIEKPECSGFTVEAFFRLGETTLTEAERRQFEQQLRVGWPNKDTALEVEAFTCGIGDQTRNIKIAEQRAQHARSILKANGYTVIDKVEIHPMEKYRDPVHPDRAINRRILIRAHDASKEQ